MPADLHGGFLRLLDSFQYKTPNYSCDLEEVPDNCSCTDLTVVVCSEALLNYVPMDISTSVTKLILNKNNITLRNNDFEKYILNLIHLEENNISVLPKNIFHGQIFLQKLLLSGNNLHELPKELFFGLDSLSWLFIENNKISELNFGDWNLQNLSWLELSHNQLVLKYQSFPYLQSLTFLYLDWNLIDEISEFMFANLPALQDLSLGWNKIKQIHPLAFKQQSDLHELNLSNNKLSYLHKELFIYIKHLEKLNLGGNIFLFFDDKLLSPLNSLRSLDLKDIDIENISSLMFMKLQKLDFVYFKRFKYCTYTVHVPKCIPNNDGSSSFTDLLMSGFLRVTLWLVAGFIISSNGLVLWHRIRTPGYKSPLNLFITSLAGSDLLMGIYLIIIGIQDIRFKGNYLSHVRSWMSSWLCTISGLVAMISSEVSVLILLLISAERYLLISAPLNEQKSLRPKVAILSVSAIWLFSLFISILPVFQWNGAMRFYGTNSFCFPLHIDDPYTIGWQYSAVVFLGINFLGIIGIGLLYSGLFLSIYRTRHATTLNVKDTEYALRFFFIILTNSCCWVPIIIIKILAFSDVTFSGELHGWLAVFVLPINSAINPILYTFSIPNGRTIVGQGDSTNENCLIRKGMLNRATALKQSIIYQPPRTSDEQI